MIHARILAAVLAIIVAAACTPCPIVPPSTGGSTVTIENTTSKDAIVYFAFGADSVVLPPAWSFCTSITGLTCSFRLAAKSTQALPLGGQYLNVTVSFNSAVTCGTTKAELNVNNPKWFNTLDISLVDGFNSEVLIESMDGANKTVLGPVWTATHNEKNFGVFPLGCDICVARQKPSCGMQPGTDGCKSGTQYKPDVPCQFQGATMGGTGAIRVALLEGQPAAQ